mgnify:CR=1 FL=1
MNNKIILQQMIRLSRIIKDSREARAKLNSIQAQTEYFIVEGNQSTFIRDQANSSITNCLYVEQYLRSSVNVWMVLMLQKWNQ